MTDGATLATARLLWAACRPAPDRDGVQDAIEAGADTGVAIRTALGQRVGPLLWVGLREAGVVDRLGADGEALRREFDCRRAQAPLLLPLAAAAALEPLMAAGLEPVVFKGPALALRYPDPGLRPMDDIDLLLPVGYEQGLTVLHDAGWETWNGEHGADYDTVLFHPRVPHLPLELHRGLDQWYERSNHLTATELWRRRQPLDCFGTLGFGLPPEEELVALAAHAGKPYHQFRRLLWSVDLAVVVQAAGPKLDWDRVAHLARRYACTTVVAVGLRLARRLGADVPDRVLALPSSRRKAAALEPLLAETWPLVTDDHDMHRGLRFALSDARRRKLLLALGVITKEGAVGVPRNAVRLATRRARRVWAKRGYAGADRT